MVLEILNYRFSFLDSYRFIKSSHVFILVLNKTTFFEEFLIIQNIADFLQYSALFTCVFCDFLFELRIHCFFKPCVIMGTLFHLGSGYIPLERIFISICCLLGVVRARKGRGPVCEPGVWLKIFLIFRNIHIV